MYVTPSIFIILGFRVCLFFMTLFRRLFLGKHAKSYMWFAIGIISARVIMAGGIVLAANTPMGGGDNPILGVGLYLLASLFMCLMLIFEDKVISDSFQAFPPLLLVSMEGLCGLFFTVIVLFPIAYAIPGNDMGSFERYVDSWIMLESSRSIQILCVLWLLSSLGLNVFGVLITLFLDTVWRTIAMNVNLVPVWLVDLLILYVVTHGTFGESWIVWSWLQLVAPVCLLFATVLYSVIIKFPWCSYALQVSTTDGQSSPTTETAFVQIRSSRANSAV
jgi:hypothetical protein